MIDNTVKTQEQIDIYTDQIYQLVDEFINQELATDPDILNNYGLFPRLIQYVYSNYIKSLLNNGLVTNKNKYPDINLLDHLFNIYIDLVYKYKLNKRPSLIEFSIYTGINKNTFYDWINGNDRYINTNYSEVAQKWQTVCEQALIDDRDTVKSIFLLKCKHDYQEQPTQVILNTGSQVLTAQNLPKLSVDMSHNDIIQTDQKPILDNKTV